MKNKKYYQYIINLLRPYKTKLAILFLLVVMTAVGTIWESSSAEAEFEISRTSVPFRITRSG